MLGGENPQTRDPRERRVSMSTENEKGDEVYQPDGSEVQEDTNLLPPEDTLVDHGVDPETRGYSPPERPVAVESWGTTANEQREGEPLDDRLASEVPELTEVDTDEIGDLPGGEGEPLDREAGDRRSGRLVAIDEGVRADEESDLIGSDVGIDSAAASAEEAAMHTVEEEADEPGAGLRPHED